MLLADIEEHVLLEGGGLLGVGDVQGGDLGCHLRVEPLGDVDVLVEPAHRVPEVLLFQVERHVVALQLVLALA